MATNFVSQAKHKPRAIFEIFTPYESVLGVDDRFEIFLNISRDVAMATNFVSYKTFSIGAEVSQDPLHRFSQSLHHMVGIELQMINPNFFSRYLKGRCHGNQFCGEIGEMTFIQHPGILELIGISQYGSAAL